MEGRVLSHKYSIIYMVLPNMSNENFIFHKIYLEFVANFLNIINGFHKSLWILGSNRFNKSIIWQWSNIQKSCCYISQKWHGSKTTQNKNITHRTEATVQYQETAACCNTLFLVIRNFTWGRMSNKDDWIPKLYW